MAEQASKRASVDDDRDLDAEPPPTTNKRRRIGLACNACRMRKSRCDGLRPSCASCLSLGFECIYEPGDSATNVIVRKDYVSDLEQRVASVEHKLQRLNDVLKGHLLPCPGAPPCRTAGAAQSFAAAEPTDTTRATDLEEPQDEDASTNGMAMIFLEEQSSALFGESSNINFTQLLFRGIAAVHQTSPAATATLARDSALAESIASFSRDHFHHPPAQSAAPADSCPTILPSVEEIDHLLDVYFDTAGAVFPFIHEETMRNTYAECKRNNFTRARRTWLGALNMIFAMASTFDKDSIPSAKKRFEKSNVFYKRALELCGDLSKRVISLEIVHYLLLVVIHCQGTQRSVQAWNTHGLVTRSAIALGLHSNAVKKAIDPIQAEFRRRTWVVIYCLDKILSVAFGRPASIPDELMNQREPALGLSPSSPGSADISVDLPGQVLAVSFKMYQVMAKSLVNQYGANLESSGIDLDDIDSLKASGELRKMLQSWVARLPPHLCLLEPDSNTLLKNTPANRLRVILTLRHHNLGILIHKPLLSATIRHLFRTDGVGGEAPPYLIQLAMAEAHECIRAAQLTIDIVHAIISADPTGENNLGAPFFTLYYVFTASLVISGRLLWAQHGQSTADEPAVQHARALLSKVDTIFHALDHENSLVWSCLEYIRRLARMCGVKGLPPGTSEGCSDTIMVAAAGQSDGFGASHVAGTGPVEGAPLSTEDIDAFQLFTSEIDSHGIF
ncbi:C6 transcription factor [Apiospora arundinis]|uniref:C6 transcription factor n=1 Tax=Apiospora arundinis TaxID=335852 RepID=A0ABR2J3I7_9PEZI